MTPASQKLGKKPPREVGKLPGERESLVENDGLKLHLREWGNPAAPPIVLLHGLRGYSGTWRQLAATMHDRWRVIALDARGRGDSDWDTERNYYTDAYLADLEVTVDALGLNRFVLLGHSMGGTTAYCYAARNPERLAALIIEDITAGSSVKGPGFERIVDEMSALPASFADWGEARAYWRKLRPNISVSALEERLSESMRESDGGKIVWRYDAAGIAATRINPDPARVVDLWPVVETIRTPTLVIRGGNSDFCNLDTTRELERRNPMLAHVTVPGASHYVHGDEPKIFHGLVEGFLAGIAVLSRSDGRQAEAAQDA